MVDILNTPDSSSPLEKEAPLSVRRLLVGDDLLKELLFSLAALFVSVWALYRAERLRMRNLTLIADLRRELEKALHLLRKRSELANEIAHEIKNPITAILCSAETLDLIVGPNLPSEHRRSLKYIKEYGDNLLRLVSDFLDLSRTENRHVIAKPEAVDVVPIVHSIIGLLESNAIKKKINVSVDCAVHELKAFIDPRHLKQITFNLLHNAIKYTQGGGAIRIKIRSDFPSPWVHITVTDNGPGVPRAMQQRIFDAYARYEQCPTSVDVGTGLGLALCKALVELAGGSIVLRSEPGAGSEFEFAIPEFAVAPKPLVLHAEEAAHAKDGEVRKPCMGQRLLIVDSNQGVRDALGDLVCALGGVADKADRVSEALEAIARCRYDAVIVDRDSLGEDIKQIAGAIEDVATGEHTRLIVAADGEYSVESGKVIEKPLNGKRLIEALHRS